jgi:hypothetical protein
VVPADFTEFFATAAGGAGVLIGLLFVAVSLRPESVFGDSAPPAGRAVAGSAFTALVNSFFVALSALIPHASLGYSAGFLALASLYSIIRLHRGLAGKETHKVALAFSVAAYLGQFGVSAALVTNPRDDVYVYNLAYLLIASLAVALSRAWALLQGKHAKSS